jgi:pyruvate dehydrogenase E2 component (dihydrolipoamide acetyltransferase)
MPTPIAMPRQGQSVELCVLFEWHKDVGETVATGEVLFSYETDKASFEFESPVDGTLLATFYEEGDDVPVLNNVAVIGDNGEDSAQFTPDNSAVPAAAESASAPIVAATPAPAAATPAPLATGGVLRVSPRARQRAAQSDVNVAQITGTGPQGRVIERDVLAAPAVAAGPVATAPIEVAPLLDGDEVKDTALSNIRKIIAQRMVESLQQAAQFTLTASADATAIMACRRIVKERREQLGIADININDLVAYATVRTLIEHPYMNACFLGDKIREYESVHLAFAADSPRGLMVPVIRFANDMSLNELAAAGKDLATQVREGKVPPDLLSGGTFTLSNLGAFGVESFTPVLNLPQVAILGVNTITQRPVAQDGETVLRPHIGLSLTIDHRAVDGAPAARFLQDLCGTIANFDLTLLM